MMTQQKQCVEKPGDPWVAGILEQKKTKSAGYLLIHLRGYTVLTFFRLAIF